MQLEKQTYPDKSVIKTLGQFVPVKINIDKLPKVAQMYAVSSIPALMFMEANGKPWTGFLGFLPPREFNLMVKDAFSKRKNKK